MKKIFALVLLLGFFLPPALVIADIAPNPPECYNSSPRACGFFSLDASVDLGEYKEEMVLLQTDLGRYVSSVDYSIADQPARMGGSHLHRIFLAVDKNYFLSKGGIAGLYTETVAHDEEFGDFATMEPKNYEELRENSYEFLVYKDDGIIEYKNSDLEIEGKYAPLPGFYYPYIETNNVECGYEIVCEESLIYTPKSIVTTSAGKFMVLQAGQPQFTYPAAENQTQPSSNTTTPLEDYEPRGVEVLGRLNFISAEYIQKFSIALLLTLVVEVLLLWLFISKVFKIADLSVSKVIAVGIFASAFTLPYVWFVFPWLWSWDAGLVIAEVFAFVAEAIFYKVFLKLSFKQAILISLAANLASYLLGKLL